MLEISFTPKRLIQVKNDVVLLHSHERVPKPARNDDKLRNLILRLVALELYQVKKNALALTDEEVLLVASYLPFNYYAVDMKNLFLVYQYRSNRKSCEVLYSQWQDSFENDECNRYMCDLLEVDERFILYIRENSLSESLFADFLKDTYIPLRFAEELKHRIYKEGLSLNDKLETFGIRVGSKLYHEIEFLFYTFCSKADYLSAIKQELLATVRKYGMVVLKKFLLNFLEKLELKELQEFPDLANYVSKQVGEYESIEFRDFFEDISSHVIVKYKDWINICKINQVFGYDERSRFWKQYRYISVKKYTYSNAVVMEMGNYYATEFLGDAMGPIYFYTKDVFDASVRKWFERYDNTELRSLLYNHDELYIYRKVHIGYWQYDINNMLLRRRMTERII